MIVKIVPIRPIPGILPKNKWIDSETVLDLNKNEILHCMQYGNVYDENGDIIDAVSVHKTDFNRIKGIIKPIKLEPVIVEEIPTVTLSEPVKEEEVVIMGPITVIEEPSIPAVLSEQITVEVALTTTKNTEPLIIEADQEPIIEPVPVYNTIEEVKEEPFFKLEQVSCVKEDNHIILTTRMNTNSKLEGNLYGLFTITSGTRPVIEYKDKDNWVKFNNKFANFNSIENADKFIFRFAPKNDNEFSYKILIKEANEVIAKLEEKINPANL